MLFSLKKVIKIAFKSKKEKIAFKIGFLRGKKFSKSEKKPNGDLVSIGSRKNIRVDKQWFNEFKKKYPYANKVVSDLSFFKHQKGITAYSKDQEYLEKWANSDKERHESSESTFDVDEFFNAALERSYLNIYGKNKK